ncbi:MAG: tetratricopeptide repeat protein, partial [bacterium]
AALTELDKAVALNPNYFDAHYYRGLVLSALGQSDEALAALQRAAKLKPDNLELTIAMPNALREAGREDEALTAYWQLLEKQPGRVATHDDLNSYAWSIGRKDLFLKSFAYAREREGEKPDLLLHEAALRMRANEGEEAERLLMRACEIAPERADVAGMLGRVLAYNRKYAESFPHFLAAIARDPAAASYRHEFGFALLNDNQPKEALHVLEEARALDANDQLTLAGLALAYRELGDSRYGQLVDFDRHVRVYDIRLPQSFASAKAFNEMLAEELKRLHTSKVEPIDQSLRNGTQTVGDLFNSNAFAIREVREGISEAVADYIKQMPNDAAHPLFSRKDENFTYSGSWSCQLRSSGYHANHVHPK